PVRSPSGSSSTSPFRAAPGQPQPEAAVLARALRLFGRIGQEDRAGCVVGDAGRLEELDLRVHAVALADAVQPGPGVERFGRCVCLPQVDAAGPAALGVDEVLADQPRDAAEARWDGADTRRAAAQAEARREVA